MFASSASFRGLVRLPGVVVLLDGQHALPGLGPQDGQTLLRTSGCAVLGPRLLIIINVHSFSPNCHDAVRPCISLLVDLLVMHYLILMVGFCTDSIHGNQI